MQQEWIMFDIAKIKQLKEDYDNTIAVIKESLPEINLNSSKQIVNFFEKTFQIELKSARIKEISAHLDEFHEDSEEREIIDGIVHYYKMYYTVKNYLDYIIKHNEAGVMVLREYMGQLCFQNRQRVPYSPDIINCITRVSRDGLLKEESSWQASTKR